MDVIPFSNYPANISDRHIDKMWGPDLSDAAVMAVIVHSEIQAHIAALKSALTAHADCMLVEELYSELFPVLEDTVLSTAELDAVIYEEEENRIQDARNAYNERRYEERRDEGF